LKIYTPVIHIRSLHKIR